MRESCDECTIPALTYFERHGITRCANCEVEWWRKRAAPSSLVTIGECLDALSPLQVEGQPTTLIDLIKRANVRIEELTGGLADALDALTAARQALTVIKQGVGRVGEDIQDAEAAEIAVKKALGLAVRQDSQS